MVFPRCHLIEKGKSINSKNCILLLTSFMILRSLPYLSSVSTNSIMISLRSLLLNSHFRQTRGLNSKPESSSSKGSTWWSQSAHSCSSQSVGRTFILGGLLVSVPTPLSLRSTSDTRELYIREEKIF